MTDSRELANEVRALKIKVDLLESYLGTVMTLPILGPNTRETYRLDLNKALAKADLAQEP